MKGRIIGICCLLLGCMPLMQAQTTHMPPKVVVGISIDGLNHHYLSLFWNELSSGGFKRLVAEGTTFEDFSYGYEGAGSATDLATLQTGALPYLHGIVGNRCFLRKVAKSVAAGEDPASYSFGEGKAYSAHRLQASTISDQLAEDSNGRTQIISIATDPTSAVMQAGHAGLALWVDAGTGRWTTSSYYQTALPSWTNKTADDYLIDKVWEPLHLAALYHAAPRCKTKKFSHKLDNLCSGSTRYEQFLTTPYANSMVLDAALQAFQHYEVGRDMQPDMLLLQFSLQPLFMQASLGLTLELEDAYLRLDKHLAELLDFIDKRFGKKEVLVYLTDPRSAVMEKPYHAQIPSKSFCSYRYMALLNAYLMAHYGNQPWVQGTENGHIYLNRQLIEEQNKDLKQMQQTAARFFATIPGVMNVSCAYQLNENFVGTQSLRYAYHPTVSGDLLFSLQPGWYEVDKNEKPTGFATRYQTATKLFLWGWRIHHATVQEQVAATSFAPSLAGWLKIGLPNATQRHVLPLTIP